MTVKLTTELWRERKAKERRAFEAGTIPADKCYMEKLFPDAFIDRTEVLLKEFVASLNQSSSSANDYTRVMLCIETLIVALNKVNEDFNYAVIETDEREALCAFVDDAIVAKGIDIDALAAAQNCGRNEITDEWRNW